MIIKGQRIMMKPVAKPGVQIMPVLPGTMSPTPGVQTPGYPGQKVGLSLEDSRAVNNSQIKTRGYVLDIAAGAVQEYPINISGFAREIVGLAVHAITFFDDDASAPSDVSLLINEEKCIDEHPFSMLDIKYIDGEYYKIPRLVAGNDNIELRVNNPGVQQSFGVVFYYR